MNKVKNVIFRLNLEGKGIVNFDDSDQKKMYFNTNMHHMKTNNDNTSYAKKRFYGTKDDLSFKIAISSDCLRHDIFKDDVLFQSPNVINNTALLYSFIASPVSLLRGYLFAEKEAYKRKGPLTITDAEQTCDAITSIDVHTRSGYKNKETGVVDNTFFYKESVGDISYSSIGQIDLMQLQFISCDQIFDRYAFNPDMFNIYKQFLQTKMPSFNSELGYYQIDGSSVQIPEYGIKLTNENVVFLVREMFERILKLNINRKGSYAKVSNLEYKLVYDVLEDTYDSEDGWNTIKTKEDINNIQFDVTDFYIAEDLETAEKTRKLIEADVEARKNAKKEAKAEEANAKKIAKETAKQSK